MSTVTILRRADFAHTTGAMHNGLRLFAQLIFDGNPSIQAILASQPATNVMEIVTVGGAVGEETWSMIQARRYPGVRLTHRPAKWYEEGIVKHEKLLKSAVSGGARTAAYALGVAFVTLCACMVAAVVFLTFWGIVGVVACALFGAVAAMLISLVGHVASRNATFWTAIVVGLILASIGVIEAGWFDRLP